MIDNETQGRRIQQIAEALGMSQRQVAVEAGLSQPTLNRIINGTRRTPMGEVVKIAYALGCPVSRLVAENPVADRLQFAHRFTERDGDASAASVREKLTRFFEMDVLLDERGVARVA